MSTKKEQEIKLTPEEMVAIEERRRFSEKLEKFKADYQFLVEETGFTWVVDANSQLNNIQLGIAKAPEPQEG